MSADSRANAARSLPEYPSVSLYEIKQTIIHAIYMIYY